MAIRTQLRDGDVERLIALHRAVYLDELGWAEGFDAHVREGIEEVQRAGTLGDCAFWFAERGEALVGTIAMVPRGDGAIQLRWLVVAADARGHGLGRLLVEEALEHARRGGFRSVYLWTVDRLRAAGALYRGLGFARTHAQAGTPWDPAVVQERYELLLRPQAEPGEAS